MIQSNTAHPEHSFTWEHNTEEAPASLTPQRSDARKTALCVRAEAGGC